MHEEQAPAALKEWTKPAVRRINGADAAFGGNGGTDGSGLFS